MASMQQNILKCRHPQNAQLIHCYIDQVCLSPCNTVKQNQQLQLFKFIVFFLSVSTHFSRGCGVYCLHHTPAAAVPVEINRRKSRGPFLQQQCATRLAVLWVGVWLISFLFFFFFLEWKNSAHWPLLSLRLLPPLPTCTVYITRPDATSSCMFSRGRQVEFWETQEIAWGEEGCGEVAAAESRSPNCWCVFLLQTSDVQVITSLVCSGVLLSLQPESQKPILECPMNI